MTRGMLAVAGALAVLLAMPGGAAADGVVDVSLVSGSPVRVEVDGDAEGNGAFLSMTEDGRLRVQPDDVGPSTIEGDGGACEDVGPAVHCTLPAGPVEVWVSGGPGTDTFRVTETLPVFRVQFDGGEGADFLRGAGERDDFRFEPGADLLDGNGGSDSVDYTSAEPQPVTVTLDGGNQDGPPGHADDVQDVEQVITGSGNDVVDASAAAAGLTQVVTRTGNDTITGSPFADAGINPGSGTDEVRAGAGDDAITSDQSGPVPNADLLDGQGGRDVLQYVLFGPEASITLDGAANDGRPGEGLDVRTEDVDVVFATGKVTLVGDDGPNRLEGGPGADTITGGGGADELLGGDGDDTVLAADGVADTLDCGGGTGDAATVDELVADVVAGCEATTKQAVQPPPAGGGGGQQPGGQQPPGGGGPGNPLPPPPPGPAAAADTTRPAVTLAAVRALRRTLLRGQGQRLTVTLGEPASVVARLRRGRRLVAQRTLARGGGRRSVLLRASRPGRRLLAGARSLVLTVTATDAAGNTTTVVRTIRLR